VIIGTAGHIDHGKSALVQALTGRSMDPLPEERRRGITIDLHFAALSLPGLGVAGVVDVPGHEALVRTMVAGAAGIDLVLLVVAADEGIMPQTREHLAVVEQLRIPAGIPVITKADLVEQEWLALLSEELVEWLRASPVRFGEPVATSVESGQGIDSLRTAISRSLSNAPARGSATDLVRLPIDRAFSLPGAGTVVTGTAWSGAWRVGDTVRVLPGGLTGRIRSLERHGEPVTVSQPGERIAVGVAGLERGSLERGQTLVREGDPWEATGAVDAQIELLPSAPRPLTHHTRLRVHWGTLEVLARAHLKQTIEPGQRGLVRLVLEKPGVARGGDRLVLRSYSPVEVIGGGEIVDPLPPPGRLSWADGLSNGSIGDRMAALLGRRPGGIELARLPVLLGVGPAQVEELLAGSPVERVGQTVVPRASVLEAERRAVEAVRAHHEKHPAEDGMPMETLRQMLRRDGAAGEAAIARLLQRGTLRTREGMIHEDGFAPRSAGGAALVERLVSLLASAGLAPPSVAELESAHGIQGAAEALRLAARSGRVVAVERDRYFAESALAEFTAALARVAAAGPITPAAVREATGATRKYLIPLLEWSDRAGFTIRRGEARVAGPGLLRLFGGS
jgi:selenocysteine-specific elongation factor